MKTTSAHPVSRIKTQDRRDILAAVLAGVDRAEIRARYALSSVTLSHLLSSMSASANDRRQIDNRSLARDCITCRAPFLSQHAGVRMCDVCRCRSVNLQHLHAFSCIPA